MATVKGFTASVAVPEAMSREKSGKFGKGPWKRTLIAARMIMFFFLYAFWPVFRRYLKPDIVFLVYGTDQDKRTYWPRWAEKLFRPVFPIGIIRFNGLWGFIGATLTSAEDMDGDPKRSRQLLEAARKEFPKARRFALAGRLPGFLRKAGEVVTDPFVEGQHGTRFAMLQAALALVAKAGIRPDEASIAILGGAGYIGAKVVSDLASSFCQIVAFDPRYAGERRLVDNVLYTAMGVDIGGVDLALVLTAQGDEVSSLVSHFTSGIQLADDTHPPIHREVRHRLHKKGVILWKATMADGALYMYPRLPNFRRDDVPGCLLEALVVLLHGEQALESQQSFNLAAERVGFRARLEIHSDDS